jgi:hypothetical protein
MRKTKQQILTEFFELVTSDRVKTLNADIDRLVKEKRITTGAAYYVYNIYKCYHHQELLKYAGYDKSKRDHVRLWFFTNALEEVKKAIDKAEAFIETNSTCDFFNSQKQIIRRAKAAKEVEQEC